MEKVKAAMFERVRESVGQHVLFYERDSEPDGFKADDMVKILPLIRDALRKY